MTPRAFKTGGCHFVNIYTKILSNILYKDVEAHLRSEELRSEEPSRRAVQPTPNMQRHISAPVVCVVGVFCDCVCTHVSLGSVPSAREVFENLRVIARCRYGFTNVLF